MGISTWIIRIIQKRVIGLVPEDKRRVLILDKIVSCCSHPITQTYHCHIGLTERQKPRWNGHAAYSIRLQILSKWLMDWFSKHTEPQTPKLTTVTFDADSDNGKADAQIKWVSYAANMYLILIRWTAYVCVRFLTFWRAQVHILPVYLQNIWLFYSYYFYNSFV